MQKEFIKASLLKSADDVFTFIASDETVDRQGESLPMDAWDLRNFKKNPVLLINHDYKVENIVGSAKKIRVENGQLIFDAVFHEITTLAKEVKKMVEDGWLKTVSVGFMRKSGKSEKDPMINELFEVSLVPVPANPSAERIKSLVADAAKQADKNDEVKQWVDKQSETSEVQSVICSKDTFKSAEEATAWIDEHDFKSDKIDETDDSYKFTQFAAGNCQTDSEKTIEITEGVSAVICRPKKAADETELKEGRVISGKNRKLIGDTVSSLKQAAEALELLLQATEQAPKSESDGSDKGRDRKELHIYAEAKKAPHKTVKALQNINAISNALLRELKQ